MFEMKKYLLTTGREEQGSRLNLRDLLGVFDVEDLGFFGSFSNEELVGL